MHLLKSSNNTYAIYSKDLGQCVRTNFLTSVVLVLNHSILSQTSIFLSPSFFFKSLHFIVDDVEDPMEVLDMIPFPQRICRLFIEPNDTPDNTKEEIRDVHHLESEKVKMGCGV